jgi:hypothetical protein
MDIHVYLCTGPGPSEIGVLPVCVYVNVSVCVRMCMHVSVCAGPCLSDWEVSHLFLCMYRCIQVGMHVCLYVCVFVCIHVRMCVCTLAFTQ